jgi:hypothetical protein
MRNLILLFILIIGLDARAQGWIPSFDIGNINVDGNTISTTDTNGNLIISPNGSGLLEYTPGTASRVLLLDASKRLVTGDVSSTELDLLNGLSGTLLTNSNSVTVTGKTIDGDDNTVQDLSIGIFKPLLANGFKFLTFDGFGNAQTTYDIPGSAVVGVDDVQALTNKDIDGGTASNSSRLTIPKASKSTLDGLTRKEATLVYASDEKKAYIDDGSNLVKVGSGAGGSSGINILSEYNPNAEDGTTDWTASGSGTFTTTTTAANVGNGSASFSFDAAATNDSVYSTTVTIPAGLYGQNCLAEFYYKGFDSQISALVIDSSGVVTSQTLAASTGYTKVQLNFVCPSSGTLKFGFFANANAAIGYWDEVHLGSASNISQVSQASLVGSIKYAAAASCDWGRTGAGSDSFGNFSADTDCASPTLTGNAVDPGSKIPAIKFSSLPPGEYRIEARGFFYKYGSQDAPVYFRFSDGTNTTPGSGLYSGASPDAAMTLTGRIKYTTAQSNVTINIQGTTVNTSNTVAIGNNNPTFLGLEIDVYRYPLSSETAVNYEPQNWRVDANISGANPSQGTSAVTSYTGIENGSLTLTNNNTTGYNVLTAQIPCSSTNAPSGTTCSSGNESVGVSFNIPRAGDVRACVTFSSYLEVAAASSAVKTFQIVETPNNAQTISQEGKSRMFHSFGNNSVVSGGGASSPFHLCGTFTFPSNGQKTLRLMYEQSVTGTLNSSIIVADADTNNGQRDIHWEVYPIGQNFNAPNLVGSVTSDSSGAERVERVKVEDSSSDSNCTTSPCVTKLESGDWVSSATRGSTGNYVVNFNSGIFSASPVCTCSAMSFGTGSRTCTTYQATTSSVQVAVHNGAGTAVDGSISLICMGPR